MAITLDSIVKSALILAFIIPLLTYINVTVATPKATNSTQYNITLEYNATATQIAQAFEGTTKALSNLGLNQSGGFYASPIEYEAFAFIFDGLGQFIQDLVQLPILDTMALHMMALGLDTVVPGVFSTAIAIGIGIMQFYLLFSLLITGVSMVMKYNAKNG